MINVPYVPVSEDPTTPEVPGSKAPVLISVTLIVLLVSASVSFNTSLMEPSVTVKVEFVDISIVLLSFDAAGASFAPVTEIVLLLCLWLNHQTVYK